MGGVLLFQSFTNQAVSFSAFGECREQRTPPEGRRRKRKMEKEEANTMPDVSDGENRHKERREKIIDDPSVAVKPEKGVKRGKGNASVPKEDCLRKKGKGEKSRTEPVVKDHAADPCIGKTGKKEFDDNESSPDKTTKKFTGENSKPRSLFHEESTGTKKFEESVLNSDDDDVDVDLFIQSYIKNIMEAGMEEDFKKDTETDTDSPFQPEAIFADMEKQADSPRGWDYSKIAIGCGAAALTLFLVYKCFR